MLNTSPDTGLLDVNVHPRGPVRCVDREHKCVGPEETPADRYGIRTQFGERIQVDA
jgi:hypothetical protein